MRETIAAEYLILFKEMGLFEMACYFIQVRHIEIVPRLKARKKSKRNKHHFLSCGFARYYNGKQFASIDIYLVRFISTRRKAGKQVLEAISLPLATIPCPSSVTGFPCYRDLDMESRVS